LNHTNFDLIGFQDELYEDFFTINNIDYLIKEDAVSIYFEEIPKLIYVLTVSPRRRFQILLRERNAISHARAAGPVRQLV
jgi:hypothetical protein